MMGNRGVEIKVRLQIKSFFYNRCENQERK